MEPFPDITLALVDKVCYIDSIFIYLPEFPDKETLSMIRKGSGSLRRLEIPQYAKKWVYGVAIHQPSTALLNFLSLRYPIYLLVRVDVVLDLITKNFADGMEVHDYLIRRLIKRWRGNQTVNIFKNTFYTSRNGSVNENYVIYSDKPSKLTGEPCCHLEVRLMRAATIQSQGLGTLQRLMTIDYRKFFAKKIRLLSPYPDLEKMGKIKRNQPKRKSPWLAHYPKLKHPINRYVQIGSRLIRCSNNLFPFTVAQESLDFLGNKYKPCFPVISNDWLLPPE